VEAVDDHFQVNGFADETTSKKRYSPSISNVRHSSPLMATNNAASNISTNPMTSVMNNIARLKDIMVDEMKVLHSKLDDISNRTKIIEDKLDKLTKNECDKSSNNNDNLPLGIRNIVRATYKTLPEENIWNFNETSCSTNNQKVTLEMIRSVKEQTDGEFDSNNIRKAAAKYFEGLKRTYHEQIKDMTKYEETKMKKNLRSRRKRLYDARKKYLSDDLEKKIWDGCDQSFMSDEEEGKDCFVRRTITWRHETLTNLCRTLDRRWGDDDQAVKRVPRIDGDISSRPPTRKDHLFVNLDQED